MILLLDNVLILWYSVSNSFVVTVFKIKMIMKIAAKVSQSDISIFLQFRKALVHCVSLP